MFFFLNRTMHERANTSHALPTAATTLAIAALVIAYLPGLQGPFILDDHVNLAPLRAWLSGNVDAKTVILDGASGPLGRPLAYASFLINTLLFGMNPAGFKWPNLLVHILNLLLAYTVVRKIQQLIAERTAAWSGPPWSLKPQFALFVCAVWASHPLLASTVLYTVQRMTLLAATGQLLALWCWLHGRQLAVRNLRTGAPWLLFALPACVALGALAKENALIVIPLIGALELLFLGTHKNNMPVPIRAPILLAAIAAMIALTAMLTLADSANNAYKIREFSLSERLLTQPRVLGEYVLAHLWPSDANLGLYRDGFPKSTGLTHPVSTLGWLLFWLLTVGLAIAKRYSQPLFTVGVIWFLVGHSMEAGPWALELYFEHRNYFPGIGLWMALAGLAAPLAEKLSRTHKVLLTLTTLTLLTASTWTRASHWADLDALLEHEGPPAGELSRRYLVDRAIRANELGATSARDRYLDELTSSTAENKVAALLWSAIYSCDDTGAVPETAINQLIQQPLPIATHNHASWLGILAKYANTGACKGLTPTEITSILVNWEQSATKLTEHEASIRFDTIQRDIAKPKP